MSRLINHLPTQPLISPDRSPKRIFRLAQREDCTPLHQVCYPEQDETLFHQNFERLLTWQQKERAYIVLVEHREDEQSTTQLVASGQLISYRDGGELANLFVIERERNQGIGSDLIKILIDLALKHKLKWVEVRVEVSNTRALVLYQRLGFKERRRFKTVGGRKVIVLEMILASA